MKNRVLIKDRRPYWAIVWSDPDDDRGHGVVIDDSYYNGTALVFSTREDARSYMRLDTETFFSDWEDYKARHPKMKLRIAKVTHIGVEF